MTTDQTTPTEPPVFTPEQKARATALDAARAVLSTHLPLGKTDLGQFSTNDLVDVAEYLLRGIHPLDRFDTEQLPDLVEDDEP